MNTYEGEVHIVLDSHFYGNKTSIPFVFTTDIGAFIELFMGSCTSDFGSF